MRLSKKFAAIAITATVALTATAAFAFWSSSGSGNGSGSTANPELTAAITVHQTTVVGADLYPGGPVQTLSGNFTNSYAGSVHVASVSATLGTPLPAGCVAADFTVSATPVTVNQDIAPGATANGSWGGITIRMNNTGTSQDLCKNQTAIPVAYTSN